MKLLLSLVLACAMVLGSASVAEVKYDRYWHMENRVDVFSRNIQCNGEYVDLAVPPPIYEKTEDALLAERAEIGYEDWWRAYFREDGSSLKWNGMTFYNNDDSPNFHNTYITDRTDWWSLYFNEMYYDGGPVWEDELMEEFWGNLTFNGKKVNVYAAPPNYDPELDYWAFMRDEIGYAWYWEYYIASQMSLLDENPTNLKWKGIAFSVHDKPPEFNWDEYLNDPFNVNRLERGQLDRWAEYFVYEYSEK